MRIPINAIPKYQGVEKTHSDMADNADIRKAIFGAVPKAVEQTKEFAKYFKRSSSRETCKEIFDFLKHKINYVADGELQMIKLPSALIHTKRGDCKSYSLLTSAILTNLGIPHHFCLVSYNADPTPSHIYVCTDDGCIIDAVWGIFDSEKKPTYKYEVKPNGKMRVKSITGVNESSPLMGKCGCGCNSVMCQTGIQGKKERQQRRAERKEKRQERRAERKANKPRRGAKVALTLGRNLFLIAAKANLDGIASKMQKMDFSKISALWKKAGGNPKNLQKSISQGASRPMRKLGLLSMLKKKSKKINGITGQEVIDTKALELAIVPVATAAGAAINPAAGTAAGASLGAVLKVLIPIVVSMIQNTGTAEEVYDIQTLQLGSDDLQDEDTGDMEQSVQDFTEEMEKVFPASSGYSDSDILSIYNGLSQEKKSVWKAMQVKYGRPKESPKDSNITTYVALGAAALVGAYLMFNKKKS